MGQQAERLEAEGLGSMKGGMGGDSRVETELGTVPGGPCGLEPTREEKPLLGWSRGGTCP